MGKKISAIDAIILKFKDKGTEDTIQSHRNIIGQSGYVWWGWWAKNYENLPQKEFEYVKKQLESGSKTIVFYLYHTKKDILYKAVCEQVIYGNDGIVCPDDNSPEYYKDYPVKVWMKFRDIHETEKEYFVGKYTFLTDSLIDEKHKEKASLSSFADCKVVDFELFCYQKRTIWFLRNSIKTDNTLPSIGQFTMVMDTIAKDFYKADGTSFLVLSDLHFTDIENKHAFSLKDDRINLPLEEVIFKRLKDKKFSGIIIAGDFTWCASEKEFSLAEQFILKLMDKYSIKRSQIILVPGNHDIAFLKDYKGDFEKNKIVEVASKEARENYINFYDNIFQIKPKEEFLCSARRILLRNNLPIEIIGLDSNILQQEEDRFVGQGFVGQHQLSYIYTQMELLENCDVYSYRILVLHHHIIPAWYQETPEIDHSYSVLLDSGRLQEFIKKYRIKLVIHGHNHENQFTKITIPASVNSGEEDYTYHIIGIGSAGAKEVSTANPNVVGILDFEERGKAKYINVPIVPNGQELKEREYDFSLEN